MKKEFKRITAIFLLAIPFLAFVGVVGAVSLRHGREMAAMMSVPLTYLYSDDLYFIGGAFVVCFIFEIAIFLWATNSYMRTAASFEVLGREQEKGAHLLVRRDLELTHANEQLQKLDETKSKFISTVAHQLRTPLSGIKWTLNLLISGDMGQLNNDQKTFLTKAYESNDRMISLVTDMLGADRIESGKVRYLFQPVQLIDVLDNVLFELLPQANAKSLVIKLTKSVNLPKVHADPENLRAVFQNLLENSIKYSRPQGIIAVDMKLKGHDEVLVTVKDDGIGIPKEQHTNVFERFFRAQNAIKLETTGSGLGLFIVQNIIERHGGRIWFDSEENRGATFFFTLPIDKTVMQTTSQETTSVVDRL